MPLVHVEMIPDGQPDPALVAEYMLDPVTGSDLVLFQGRPEEPPGILATSASARSDERGTSLAGGLGTPGKGTYLRKHLRAEAGHKAVVERDASLLRGRQAPKAKAKKRRFRARPAESIPTHVGLDKVREWLEW